MNEEPNSHPGRLRTLLIIAASSVVTAILANIDRDVGSPLLWVAVLFWTLLGGAVGIWVLRGKIWQALARNARLRLAIGCFAIGWGGLAAMALPMARTVPRLFMGLVFAIGFALALIFVASLIDNRQSKRDEGDIFP